MKTSSVNIIKTNGEVKYNAFVYTNSYTPKTNLAWCVLQQIKPSQWFHEIGQTEKSIVDNIMNGIKDGSHYYSYELPNGDVLTVHK